MLVAILSNILPMLIGQAAKTGGKRASKGVLTSKTTQGIGVAAVATFGLPYIWRWAGIEVSEVETTQFVEALGQSAGLLWALYGRFKSSGKIGKA